jgi:hypothetical protein
MKLESRASFGWGATRADQATIRNGICVHYDGSDMGLAAKAHSACRTYWRNTRAFHMRPVSDDGRGWLDIGYSFGCCPHGVIFEGRGLNRVQAAQPGGNSTWYSCTFMTGDHESPTVAQLAAFAEFRSWLRGKGVAAAVKGHQDFISTSCPGDVLYRMVKNGSLAGGAAVVDWMEAMVNKLPTLSKGATGEDVQTLRGLLLARAHPEIGNVEGAFDDKVVTAVKGVQKWGGITADGVVGPKTWPVLLRVNK